MSNFKVDQIVRAVRDTSTVGGRAIQEGEQFVVLSEPDDSAYMGVTPLSGHWPARNGFPSEASGNERIVPAVDFEVVPPKPEPTPLDPARLEFTSGLADHARFQLDGDGIALDLFTPGTRAHISGRLLNSAQIQDLLHWLADHGHTLDEGDKPEPVTGRGTAYVFGMVPQGVDQRRYHGFLRDSGSFVFFDDEGA